MIRFADVTGLLGCALAIAVLVAAAPGLSRLNMAHRRWLLGGVFVAVLLPLGGLPLAGYLRGVVGDLSAASLVLLGAAALRLLSGREVLPDRGKMLIMIVVAALGFYPMALGWGDYDPYRLGYGSYGLLAYLLGLALLAAWKGLPAIALVIALAVLAWGAGWYESGNLWDYLLDPAVSLYALAAIVLQAMRKFRAARNPS